MANDWFIWKGQRSTAYGIRVLQQPAIVIPAERINYETVPGRAGSLAMSEGEDVYDDIQLTAECKLDTLDNLTRVAMWLQGEGEITFANRADGYYKARITNQISIEKIIASNEARIFSITFRAHPFFYLWPEADIVTATAATLIRNPGTVASEPCITVQGTGSVGLELDGQLVMLYDLEGGIILDTELQDALALNGAELRNSHMAGEFLRIPAGSSLLRWFSDDTSSNGGTVNRITIKPRWRCL